MQTANAPKGNQLSDTKTTDTKSDAAAKAGLKDSDQAKTDHPGELAPAGQSGDPAIQKLLADRQAHVMNAGIEEDPEVKARRDAALEAIKDIDEKLGKLGYTAK
jgi:hypothetical protein